MWGATASRPTAWPVDRTLLTTEGPPCASLLPCFCRRRRRQRWRDHRRHNGRRRDLAGAGDQDDSWVQWLLVKALDEICAIAQHGDLVDIPLVRCLVGVQARWDGQQQRPLDAPTTTRLLLI